MILPSQPELKGRSGPLYALILDKPASAFNRTVQKHALRDFDEAITADAGNEASAKAESEPSMDEDFIPGELQDDRLGGQVARISISHDGEYVTAVCLAAEEPREGDVGGEAAAREF